MTTSISKNTVIFLFMVAISSCSLLKPYQPSLDQGNFIRTSQKEQLSVGLSRQQVEFLLGVALVNEDESMIYVEYDHQQQQYKPLIIKLKDGVVIEIDDQQ